MRMTRVTLGGGKYYYSLETGSGDVVAAAIIEGESPDALLEWINQCLDLVIGEPWDEEDQDA